MAAISTAILHIVNNLNADHTGNPQVALPAFEAMKRHLFPKDYEGLPGPIPDGGELPVGAGSLCRWCWRWHPQFGTAPITVYAQAAQTNSDKVYTMSGQMLKPGDVQRSSANWRLLALEANTALDRLKVMLENPARQPYVVDLTATQRSHRPDLNRMRDIVAPGC
jgi:hypothetical protein